MRKLVLFFAILTTVLQIKAAEELVWTTDLPKAEAQAKQEHKLVWLEFSGSDWCPRCILMEKEVFAKPEFIDYAQKNLVMVLLDFPEKKKLSEDLVKKNEALQEKYKVTEYPTIFIFNSMGKKVGELGYVEGGPQAYIAKLEKLRSKNK
ncbi:thioredoxin family protein [Pedosphaera parvula]|uniref:Thiol-disulfide isomerase or thioredoxin n=1 Tax=Pedosphaera parvula (strain Ellin514) TaxID=320771 RepID=B9XKW1_PEDPL|nr:thioredoxin family protein [Pedosphaera parvula]EEF59455.1 thiol-disulfide isomerase or thioredoxin [Pedosphaera parvula Ellin514]